MSSLAIETKLFATVYWNLSFLKLILRDLNLLWKILLIN